MQRDVSHGATYVTYTYLEQEFKDKLGITEPEAVLTLERNLRTRELTVRLMSKD